MKKENIALLVFPVIWCFYFFCMQGHIAFWEESGFFMLGSHFWQQFAFRPGGWTEYAGNFLVQFYKWPVAGALLLTVIPFGVYVAVRTIAKRWAIPGNWLWVPFVPVFLILYLQGHSEMILGESLKMVCFWGILCGYLAIRSVKWRLGVLTLAFPVLFLILSTGVCIFLYLTCWLYEFWRGKGRMLWGAGILWLLLLWIYPNIWRREMYFLSVEFLYAITGFPLERALSWAIGGVYGYGILLLGIALMAKKMHRSFRKWLFWTELALVFVVVGFTFYRTNLINQEVFYRLDQAVQQGKWDQAIQIAEGIQEPTREERYLTNLALACNDQLGEKLFDFPVWGLSCLYLPRDIVYQTSVIGGEFYYRLNIPNEGIHWIFQASVGTPYGMNFRCLKRLIDLNIQKRDRVIADKYLSVLEQSVGYGAWCAGKRAELEKVMADTFNVFANRDFFIGGRPFLSDMARVLDAGKSEHLALNYILCGLLLNKDLGKFCQIFTHFYPYRPGVQIPEVYEQALLVALELQNPRVVEKGYVFSTETMQDYADYMTLYERYKDHPEEAKKMLWRFKNTCWYYFHFVTPRLSDVKGHELPAIRYSS